jgi:spermidine/putrescine transport system substrate-binding protein
VTDPRVPDAALLRGLTQARMGRRDVMRMVGAAGGAALLAGCGIRAQGFKIDTSATAIDAYWARQKPTGELIWANWPLYLDTSGKSDHPTLDSFDKVNHIKTKYLEAVQDNGPFFAQVQPTLSSSQYCGFDVAVITSGIYFAKFRDLGFLVPLDQARLPNFKKYAGEKYKNPTYDPGNVFSVPWQAGFTGIGYNPDKTGQEITSWHDLLNPRFKGHIGMMANNEDLPNIALLAIGVDPHKSTEADWKNAASWLNELKPLVRNFYSQDYISGLASGDIWISMAWSGDVFQQNLSGGKTGGDLKFVIPEEGGLIWIDNFVILRGARNPVSAMQLMDYYYDPTVAAAVTEWVNYISPVPDAQAVVRQDAAEAKGDDKAYDEAVASSYATFPGAATYDKTTTYFTPDAGDPLDSWNAVFEPIYQS